MNGSGVIMISNKSIFFRFFNVSVINTLFYTFDI